MTHYEHPADSDITRRLHVTALERMIIETGFAEEIRRPTKHDTNIAEEDNLDIYISGHFSDRDNESSLSELRTQSQHEGTVTDTASDVSTRDNDDDDDDDSLPDLIEQLNYFGPMESSTTDSGVPQERESWASTPGQTIKKAPNRLLDTPDLSEGACPGQTNISDLFLKSCTSTSAEAITTAPKRLVDSPDLDEEAHLRQLKASDLIDQASPTTSYVSRSNGGTITTDGPVSATVDEFVVRQGSGTLSSMAPSPKNISASVRRVLDRDGPGSRCQDGMWVHKNKFDAGAGNPTIKSPAGDTAPLKKCGRCGEASCELAGVSFGLLYRAAYKKFDKSQESRKTIFDDIEKDVDRLCFGTVYSDRSDGVLSTNSKDISNQGEQANLKKLVHVTNDRVDDHLNESGEAPRSVRHGTIPKKKKPSSARTQQNLGFQDRGGMDPAPSHWARPKDQSRLRGRGISDTDQHGIRGKPATRQQLRQAAIPFVPMRSDRISTRYGGADHRPGITSTRHINTHSRRPSPLAGHMDNYSPDMLQLHPQRPVPNMQRLHPQRPVPDMQRLCAQRPRGNMGNTRGGRTRYAGPTRGFELQRVDATYRNESLPMRTPATGQMASMGRMDRTRRVDDRP